ncbi:MAG: MFS transporter [Pseudomonadota bacterium]
MNSSSTASTNPDYRGLSVYFKPPVLNMLFFGFAAGLPILLIFSSLSLWLREAGVSRSMVTYFSWAALGYSFKFIWAPLVDRMPLPFLSKFLGRRRGWLLLSQLAVIASIIGMAMVDPAEGGNILMYMAIGAVALGFSSATQDVVLDAYRIEAAPVDLQALMSATYIAGYRLGMIVAGAGAIYLAEKLGSTSEHYSYIAWQKSYLIMAACMFIGVVCTLCISEPRSNAAVLNSDYSAQDYLRFTGLFLVLVSVFVLSLTQLNQFFPMMQSYFSLEDTPLMSFSLGMMKMFMTFLLVGYTGRLLLLSGVVNREMVHGSYVAPVKEFFERYGVSIAFLLLALIGFYRISDIVLGVIANVFYQDLGFDKTTIAGVVKTFGVIMTILGGFLGGHLSIRFGVMRVLLWGAILSALTNILFILLANMGQDLTMLYVVISADNLSAGLATAAFVAFLSSLVNVSFTATQYAIFSSLMTLLPKLFGGYSGTIVDQFGYESFFMLTTLMGIPVIALVILADKALKTK